MKKNILMEKHIRRFWQHVDRTGKNGCWNWTRTPASSGYGQLRVGIHHIGVHRIAWLLAYGDIPNGLQVCHTCDNKLCVNPFHLFLGTAQDNSDDKLSKYRQARGRKIGVSKLHPKDVVEIRKLLSDGVSERNIAKRYGVWGGSIRNIKLNRAWSWVK